MKHEKMPATQASGAPAFYRVLSDLRRAPVSDYLSHGYESERDFHDALRQLVNRWHDRTGKVVAERHGFFRLRFYDTPGGKPDEAWLPSYLLEPAAVPDYLMAADSSDGLETELNRAFGFD